VAEFPRGAKPGDELLANVELDFRGKLDLTHGSFLFEGAINEARSFILSHDCRPRGGFMVAAWFAPSAHAGDWCFSVGGWHPAYTPPTHYPPAPHDRLGISWHYSDRISITGDAYAALTPDTLMDGASITVLFTISSFSAHIGAHADFILQLHPLRYALEIGVCAGVDYELWIFSWSHKFSIELGVTLRIHGPPFAGTLHLDVAIFHVDIDFGPGPTDPPALTLAEFLALLKADSKAVDGQKAEGDKKTAAAAPQTDHVLALESGLVLPHGAPTAAQKPDTPWTVRPSDFAFTLTSRMAISAITLTSSATPRHTRNDRIYSRPMQLHNNDYITSELTLTITPNKPNSQPLPNFRFQALESDVPSSLWGPYSNSDDLSGNSRPATLKKLMGLRVQGPTPGYPPVRGTPRVMTVSGLTADMRNTKTVDLPKKDDSAKGGGVYRRAKKHVKSENERRDYTLARWALVGVQGMRLVRGFASTGGVQGGRTGLVSGMVGEELNARRGKILGKWAAMRGLGGGEGGVKVVSKGTGKEKEVKGMLDQVGWKVPVGYVDGLERYTHVAPRVEIPV